MDHEGACPAALKLALRPRDPRSLFPFPFALSSKGILRNLGLTLGFLLLTLELTACTTVVMGGIPPATFEFHTVIATRGAKPGGWKVAQVVILLGRISETNPRGIWCDIEIGVPQIHYLGPVLDAEARGAAAMEPRKNKLSNSGIIEA
ncbi:hypothetical protein POL68_37135 [Stigmatella sp. ncwal1]|uniref:Lipoprotein n=1 Tax=Stigmatella ashevillensis TaxID=2995309 RepID=A0ABT5DKG0_9BACT|nr:hypothetical protein [Stigmatella ashevillena]MDC0714150.1 hypothetical protein [Stigmatella ashevillena]